MTEREDKPGGDLAAGAHTQKYPPQKRMGNLRLCLTRKSRTGGRSLPNSTVSAKGI